MCHGAKMKGGEIETLVVNRLMGKKILQTSMYLCLSFEAYFFFNQSCRSFGVGFIGLGQLPIGNQVKFCKPGNRFFSHRAMEEELLALLRDCTKDCKIRISFNGIASVIKDTEA